MLFRTSAVAAAVLLSGTSLASAETLTIATVNNSDMIIMQRLSSKFTEATGHELNWVVLEENVLRQRVTTDIATGGGQFDIITVGAYETPIWGSAGWLVDVGDLGDDYDYDDLLKPVRDGLSSEGTLYAVPFYAESSFTYYRKDLFDAAGLTMPDKPTYEQIKEFAAALNKPEENVYGICLRGKPGWGENMAFVDTMVNTYGGRWFDEEWNTTINTPEWQAAITDYIDLLNNYGPPGAASNGHNENRALFASGNCAMWIDATSAAGYIFNPSESRVADTTAFAASPVADFTEGSGWAWAWALAIPESSGKQDAAKEFLKWATSKDYVQMVGETEGWVSAPPGTRQSTYDNPEYKAAAPFADATLQAIMSADPTKATRDPVPYTGVQFVAIPEFQGIGTQVGQTIAAALTGQMPVDQALQAAQSATERTMRQAGYPK
ncbi:ABC transporter substrate-binding protein [Marinivivus vitaminiproducens]|uniref:ABC transporter substrate-binding protein n=1 Tax=Marinivivus vitaminiproducens TaxID=3035935 RepID=UPI00279B03D3|nr:sugar ABC transporter substrate-binding protein [Geminicoccaceae bacterium SCSIO 64248]